MSFSKVLAADNNRASSQDLLRTMIEAVPEIILVVDREVRIAAVNSALLTFLGLEDESRIRGLRMGEAIQCVNAMKPAEGCGESPGCSLCGARRAVTQSQASNRQESIETRVTSRKDGNTVLDLNVVASPVVVEDANLTLVVMKDISAEKRRGVLERVFFHDILNTASGLLGLATALEEQELPADEQNVFVRTMVDLSSALVEEIKQQRMLVMAEKGELVLRPQDVRLSLFLREVQSSYAAHPVARNRSLKLKGVPDVIIQTDVTLLRRIIGNLVKNALEATPAGGQVTMGCEVTTDRALFHIHNSGVMSEAVQLQIFQRSFSTKAGEGRGIGAYSVKLFGEKYLKGKVRFLSRSTEGTVFTFSLPLRAE